MSPTSLDFSPYPSVHRRSAAPAETAEMRKARATTLDAPLTTPPDRARKADNNSVFFQALVEAINNRPLREIIGFFAAGLPRIIGVDFSENQFDNFLGAFQASLTELGLTGPMPRARHDEDTRVRLRASALGVSTEAARRVTQSTPRAVRKFDEFSAAMVDEPSLQAALAAGDDGLPPGLLEVVSALLGALRAASRANNPEAMRLIGEDFGSLAAALHEAIRDSEQTQRTSRVAPKPRAPAKYASVRHVRVRRSRGQVLSVTKDGITVAADEAGIDENGRLVIRKRTRR